jgi:hypothetical protein
MLWPFGLAALALGAPGCESLGPSGIAAHSAILPLEGACPDGPAEGVEFGAEVTSLKVEVSGPDVGTPVVAEGSVAALTVDEVPVGVDRQVVLYGLADNGSATWRGVRKGVEVVANEDAPIDILLSRVADLSCPRTPMLERRAFHTATRLPDGRVVIAGGARSDADASSTCGAGCTLLDGSGSIEIYDPTTGRFETAGTLQIPRMFHQATLLDDGRVAFSGGTTEALVVPPDASNPFPIKPRLAPISLIEVYDPATESVVQSVDDPNGPRLFHAAALTSDGNLLLAGGIPSQPAVNDLGNALSDTTLCDGDSFACVGGSPMNSRRAGHAAFRLDTGDVLIWGGSIDIESGGFRPEILRAGSSTFEMLDTGGFDANRFNLFFAAHSQYVGFRILSAGGLVRESDGTFRAATVDKGGVTRGAVYIFDAASGSSGALSAGPYVDEVLDPLAIGSSMFLGSAAPLPGESRAVIAGGLSYPELQPRNTLDIYSEDPFQVAPITVGGQPRTLREGRAGLVATGIGDGTVLLSGGSGAGADPNPRQPLMTSEIFTDPVDPGVGQ